jgi:DNA topoisomerase-1
MQEGDAVTLVALHPEQHFTEPPPRFTEASLVKALEEHGIGRPSTYASIISTLRDRGYVEIESRRFTATDIGKIVCRFLTDHFHKYVEYGYTADMEDELDAVSRGEEPWTVPLEKFWKPFIKQVEHIEKNVTREQVALARELGTDPASGKPVTVRMGRFGPFVQIGTKDDAEKPRFAGLRPGQKMDTIQFADAMYLFKLPRALGLTAEGEPITVAIGRFGPYVKYGSKYASLKDDDPYTLELPRALDVIAAKKILDANRTIQDFGVDNIQVLNGRYGPYVTDKARNARIPKDRDPKLLTLEECRALLAAAPPKGTRGRFGRKQVPVAAVTAATTAAPAITRAKSAPQPPARAKARARPEVKAKTKAKSNAKAKAKIKAQTPATSGRASATASSSRAAAAAAVPARNKRVAAG